MYKIPPVVCFLLVCIIGFTSNAQAPDPLGPINSIYDEQNPVLSPEGNVLFFTRGHHPANIGGRKDPGDIWYSMLQADRTWSEPKNATALNDFRWNAVLGVSPDGDILLYGHYTQTGDPVKTQGVSLAKKLGTITWGKPSNITIPYFKSRSNTGGGHWSTDGSILLLSLEGYGSKGVEDLYVCQRKGGQWSEPKNLGSVINTRYQELTPFLSEDTKTLYFSSNGHGGRGSTDIFMAERLDDTWTNWSKPTLVEGVNTEGRELGFHQYEAWSLYSSNQNSDGYGDIKIYSRVCIDSLMEKVPVLSDTAMQVKDLVTQAREGQINVYGAVYDASSKLKVDAQLTITSKDSVLTEKVEAARSMNYSVDLPSEYSFVVRADAQGYISALQEIELPADETRSMEVNFLLDPIAVGTTVNLKNVLFEQSRATLVKDSYVELDLVVEFMIQNPTVKIKLAGHTDNRGDAKQNLQLSKERVSAVKDYLVKKGIAKKRISGKGYGGTKPIAGNNDPTTRKLNRRVEFTIVKK